MRPGRTRSPGRIASAYPSLGVPGARVLPLASPFTPAPAGLSANEVKGPLPPSIGDKGPFTPDARALIGGRGPFTPDARAR